MVRNNGRELNLLDWWFVEHTANFKSANNNNLWVELHDNVSNDMTIFHYFKMVHPALVH